MHIDSFTGEYRWLSNFWPCFIRGRDLVYPSVEHSYQAAKCVRLEDRQRFTTGTAAQAKQAGRGVQVRPDWDLVKKNVMLTALRLKFTLGSELAAKLLATGDTVLVEGNTWGDTYWGVCN